MNYNIKCYDFLPEEALSLRVKVFVEEQGFCEEVDETDKIATNLVLYSDTKAIATCRIFKGEIENDYILGRLCVLKENRGCGVGSKILLAAEDKAREYGAKTLCLHSQLRAREFYIKLGYEEYGNIEYEQDCPHIWLKKQLV